MDLTIVTKKGKETQLKLPAGATMLDLKNAYAKASKLSIYRQGYKTENGKPVDGNDKTLKELNIKSGEKLNVKDYGPQIGYRTVFIVEYLGPLLFVLYYASRPAWIYGADAADKPWSKVAEYGVIAWSLHFLKRELETVFVHRFSRPTMPLFNLFKNSMYYWAFGLVIGYPLCHPLYTAPTNETQIMIGLALMAVSEFLNLCVHLQFRFMRKAEGETKRPMPSGPLFALVSCPNYTCEVLSWVGFSLFTQIAFSWAFTLVGFCQMADWALKKHRGYHKTYGTDYKKLGRKAIVPGLL